MHRGPEAGPEIPNFNCTANAPLPDLHYEDHPGRSVNGTRPGARAKITSIDMKKSVDLIYLLKGTLQFEYIRKYPINFLIESLASLYIFICKKY